MTHTPIGLVGAALVAGTLVLTSALVSVSAQTLSNPASSVVAKNAASPQASQQAQTTQTTQKSQATQSTQQPQKRKNTSKAASSDAQFASADVEKLGRITKKQSFDAKLYEVDRYFFDMDTNIDGYVSLSELKAWKANPVRSAPSPRGDKLDRYVAGDQKR